MGERELVAVLFVICLLPILFSSSLVTLPLGAIGGL